MNKVTVSFVLNEELSDFIEDSHKGLGVSKSQFVSDCIRYYINHCMDKETKEKVSKIKAIRESISKKEKIE